jgi:hypothetical protein
MLTSVAAYLYSVLALVVVAFQAALVAGAPWGKLTWGGRYPGKLPRTMRVVALLSGALVVGFAAIVVGRAGLALEGLKSYWRIGIWIVVAYSLLGVAGNSVTRSRWERVLWLPVTLLMLASSVIAVA